MNIPQANINIQKISDPSLLVGTGQAQQLFPQFPSEAIAAMGNPSWDTLNIGIFARSSIVRVGGLWLFQETVREMKQAPWSRSPLNIARSAVECGLSRITEQIGRAHV